MASNLIDLPAIGLADLRQTGGDGLVSLGLQLLEGQQLHLAHILIHTHALGERGIDFHGFLGDAAALVLALDEMQRAHVVQPVRQLHQQHAQILAHGQQELAQVLRRALLFGHRLDLGELGHAIDEPCHIGPEELLDLVDGGQRVLHRIVEQRGDDRFDIELQLGHQPRHLDRMAEIGVTAGALLAAVFLHGVDIGTVQHRLVRVRGVGKHSFDKFVLA